MPQSYERLLSAAGNHFFRTVAYLPADEIEKEQTEYKIETGETNQRKNGVAITHHFAVAVSRVKETVDQPRLTSQFCCHPTQRVGDVRKGKREHQHPK